MSRVTELNRTKLLSSRSNARSRVRTKRIKKYPIECSNKHLRILMNQGNWDSTNKLTGYYKKISQKLDFISKIPIKKGSFTSSIINKKNGKMVKFNIGDTVQIWSNLSRKTSMLTKRWHGVCVIWSNGTPYSFGFDELREGDNKLLMYSPDKFFEQGLMNQKNKNPELNARKEKYLELIAMGKLTQSMLNNLDKFLKSSKYFNQNDVILEDFDKKTVTIDSLLPKVPDIKNKFLISRFMKHFAKTNPLIISFNSYLINDKQYCFINKSRKSNGYNCFGALDTIFKEVTSCRLHGSIVMPMKCIAKRECDYDTSYAQGSTSKLKKSKSGSKSIPNSLRYIFN